MRSFAYRFALLVAFIIMDHGVECSSHCPGSPASMHAKCDMTVTFPTTSCKVLREEVSLRLEGNGGWVDPHNGGTYTVSKKTSGDGTLVLEGERVTGDGSMYTDKWQLTFEEKDNGGCALRACSESQVTSVLDFSTNYCNLKSLYCNKSKDRCPIVKYDLVDYKEDYNDCWQRKFANCIVDTQE